MTPHLSASLTTSATIRVKQWLRELKHLEVLGFYSILSPGEFCIGKSHLQAFHIDFRSFTPTIKLQTQQSLSSTFHEASESF
jgi:hypothetical protein